VVAALSVVIFSAYRLEETQNGFMPPEPDAPPVAGAALAAAAAGAAAIVRDLSVLGDHGAADVIQLRARRRQCVVGEDSPHGADDQDASKDVGGSLNAHGQTHVNVSLPDSAS
jgi:hypothetical protein